MIKSMTGFGRGEAGGWCTEIRSVNHRFSDPHFHFSRSLAALEARFREEIKKTIKRGRIDLTCNPTDPARVEACTLAVNEDLSDQVYQAMNRLKERYGLSQEVTLDHLVAYREIFRIVEEGQDLDRIWEELLPSLQEALSSLDVMRQAEGENLKRGIVDSLETLGEMQKRFKEQAPNVVEAYRERLAKRLVSLQPGEEIDETRLLQEVSLFADRCDITEEVDRLLSHIHQFGDMLNASGPHGRRMEFLLQEMNREINTIGSKGNDLQISQWVVTCKSELEKLREQIQNVE